MSDNHRLCAVYKCYGLLMFDRSDNSRSRPPASLYFEIIWHWSFSKWKSEIIKERENGLTARCRTKNVTRTRPAGVKPSCTVGDMVPWQKPPYTQVYCIQQGSLENIYVIYGLILNKNGSLKKRNVAD